MSRCGRKRRCPNPANGQTELRAPNGPSHDRHRKQHSAKRSQSAWLTCPAPACYYGRKSKSQPSLYDQNLQAPMPWSYGRHHKCWLLSNELLTCLALSYCCDRRSKYRLPAYDQSLRVPKPWLCGRHHRYWLLSNEFQTCPLPWCCRDRRSTHRLQPNGRRQHWSSLW